MRKMKSSTKSDVVIGCSMINLLILSTSVNAFVVSSSSCSKRNNLEKIIPSTSALSVSTPIRKEDLPDYGTTSIDIDQHKLMKKKRKKKTEKWIRKDLFSTTLIDETLKELETDKEFQDIIKRTKEIGTVGMTREERIIRRRALDSLGIPDFSTFLSTKLESPPQTDSKTANNKILRRKEPEILQINIGLYCNQACGHCHVESSPLRMEMMTTEIAAQCLTLLRDTPSITTLDITGGAPELNDNFRYLVRMARSLRPDIIIIDRCNLTVLQEPGQEDLVQFLKENRVRIVASLPCYSSENVNNQRGNGVFERSISALLALNEAGYGIPNEDNEGGELMLDLVYNPLGAFLPPEQMKLEAKYKEVLDENFGILFNSLFTMTNMPIKRFADFLHRRDELKDYMDLLVRNFNSDTTTSLMCLNTVSIRHDGKLFDCDFNQQLGLAIGSDDSENDNDGLTVFDLNSLADLTQYDIHNDNHCFGCTAGSGSS